MIITDSYLLNWFEKQPAWRKAEIVNYNRLDTFREKVLFFMRADDSKIEGVFSELERELDRLAESGFFDEQFDNSGIWGECLINQVTKNIKNMYAGGVIGSIDQAETDGPVQPNILREFVRYALSASEYDILCRNAAHIVIERVRNAGVKPALKFGEFGQR